MHLAAVDRGQRVASQRHHAHRPGGVGMTTARTTQDCVRPSQERVGGARGANYRKATLNPSSRPHTACSSSSPTSAAAPSASRVTGRGRHGASSRPSAAASSPERSTHTRHPQSVLSGYAPQQRSSCTPFEPGRVARRRPSLPSPLRPSPSLPPPYHPHTLDGLVPYCPIFFSALRELKSAKPAAASPDTA